MKKNTYIKGFLYLNVLFILLLLVNAIPRSSIEKNLVKTVNYYDDKENRYYVVNELPQSNHDVVTDCIVFNIISNIEPNNVLETTLNSRYYVTSDKYSNDLRATVLDNKSPNSNYSRYWHGYTMIYKLLLIFLSVKEIKVFMLLICAGLLALLSILCYKNNLVKVILPLYVSFAICMILFSFNTLGHLFPLIISLIGSNIIVSDKYQNESFLFFILGISVAFFDFLSIETLTLTLPLICLIAKYKEENKILNMKNFISLNIHWLLGYIVTFLYKWLLCILVLGKEHLQTATIKGLEEFKYSSSLTSGISLNINMLFPKCNSSNKTFVIYLLFLLLVGLFCFLFHKKDCNKYKTISCLTIIFFIPYIRFLVLNNHSVYHYFFTYRAQISSILCLFLIIQYTLDLKMILKILKIKPNK